MKTYPDLKAVVSFGSNGPIGAGRAVKEEACEKQSRGLRDDDPIAGGFSY